MAKIKIPNDYDTLKIIRAFNERLRQARKMYGEKSYIVREMIAKAKMVSELKWSESGKTISKSKANVAAINTVYLKDRVIRFLKENSAVEIIKDLITPNKMKEIKQMPKVDRNQAIAQRTNQLGTLTRVLNKIWDELYNIYDWDKDSCDAVYDELNSRQYMDELNEYLDGEINADELGRKVLHIEIQEFDPNEEPEPEGGFNE